MLDHVLKVPPSFNPVERKNPPIHTTNPGHHLCLVGLLAGDQVPDLLSPPNYYVILSVGSLKKNKPLFITPQNSIKLCQIECE